MTGPAPTPRVALGDNGLVLVTVIWLLALLGGVTTAMALYVTSTVGTLDVFAKRLQAEAALEGGLRHAVAAFLAGGMKPSGKDFVRVGDATVTASWIGETARIDLNYAPADLLAGLFVHLGVEPDLADTYARSIVTFRGLPPEAKRSGPGGKPPSETPDAIYAAAHRLDPKPDSHRPFVDVGQLGPAAGLSPAVASRAAPFLTTFSGAAAIDPRIAAREVIEALPEMTRERVLSLLELRERPGDLGTLDDALGPSKPFTSRAPPSSIRFHLRSAMPDGLTVAAQVVVVTYVRDRLPFRVVSWDDEEPSRGPGERKQVP